MQLVSHARGARPPNLTARGARRHILVLITLLLAKLSHSFVRETALGGLHRLYRLGAAPRATSPICVGPAMFSNLGPGTSFPLKIHPSDLTASFCLDMAGLRTMFALLMLCCSAMAFQAAPLRSSAPASRAAASSISVRCYPTSCQTLPPQPDHRPQACGPPSLPGEGRLHRRQLIMPACLPLPSVRVVIVGRGRE